MSTVQIITIVVATLIGWQVVKAAMRQWKHQLELWIRRQRRRHGTQTKRVYHRQPSNGQPKSGTPWEEFPEAWKPMGAAK